MPIFKPLRNISSIRMTIDLWQRIGMVVVVGICRRDIGLSYVQGGDEKEGLMADSSDFLDSSTFLCRAIAIGC